MQNYTLNYNTHKRNLPRHGAGVNFCEQGKDAPNNGQVYLVLPYPGTGKLFNLRIAAA